MDEVEGGGMTRSLRKFRDKGGENWEGEAQ